MSASVSTVLPWRMTAPGASVMVVVPTVRDVGVTAVTRPFTSTPLLLGCCRCSDSTSAVLDCSCTEISMRSVGCTLFNVTSAVAPLPVNCSCTAPAGTLVNVKLPLASAVVVLPVPTTVTVIGELVVAASRALGAVAAVVAPVLAFVVAGLAIGIVYRVVGRQSPGIVSRGFKHGQIISGGLLALAHGTNDAQKTMGVITLALIANGAALGAPDQAWLMGSIGAAVAVNTFVLARGGARRASPRRGGAGSR